MTGDQLPLSLGREDLVALAVQHGVLFKGEILPPGLREYTLAVAEICASIGDQYRNDEGGRAGDEIRAHFGIS